MTSPRQALEEAAAAGLRKIALVATLALLMLTAWICAMTALVVGLRPFLGLGGALVALAAACALLATLVGTVAAIQRRGSAPRPPSTNTPMEAATRALLRVLSTRRGLRIAMWATALALVAGAFVLTPFQDDPKD